MPTADQADAPAPRGTVQLLLDPAFGGFFWGKLLATGGVWVFNIVSAVVVWNLSRSTVAVGAVSIALFAPQLVLAPASGAMADRHGMVGQLLAGRLLVAVPAAALAVTIGIGGVEGLPGAWLVILLAGVVGTGFAVGGPALMAVIPDLVPAPELPAAVALNSLPPTLGRAVGPALGAMLLVVGGPAWAFAFTCAANVVFAVVLVRLPLQPGPSVDSRGSLAILAGLRQAVREPGVLRLLLGVLAVGIGADPVVTLTPALSAAYGSGDALVGLLATAFGVGSLGGYVAMGRVRRRVGDAGLVRLGVGLLAMGMALTGVVPVTAGGTIGLAVAGVGFTWALTGTTTRIYAQVPVALRGRVMALWMIAFVGSRPAAAAVGGAIADARSVGAAFLAVAVIIGVIGLVVVADRPG